MHHAFGYAALSEALLRELLGALSDGFAARDVQPATPPLLKHALREILGALRDGFAARDVRQGYALPVALKNIFGAMPLVGAMPCRKQKKRKLWGFAPGSGSALNVVASSE